MLVIPDAPTMGAGRLAVPGSVTMGDRTATPTQYIFIQNDTGSSPTSLWYVTKIDNTRYVAAGKAPRYEQYIGVFLRDIETDSTLRRLDSTAKWTTSDSNVVGIKSVTSSGQCVIDIIRAGTAILTVEWNGLKSTLTLSAS